MTHRTQLILFCCLIAMAGLLSCFHHSKRNLPQELVDVDSALMKEDYRRGGLLLDEYEDQYSSSETEEAAMFHQLMRAFWRLRIGKEQNRVSLLDSLCNYYNGPDTQEEYALATYILCDAYRRIAEYPRALECCLQAESLANSLGNENLLCWIYRQKGLIFTSQRMFDEALQWHKRHIELANKHHHMRQLIMGLHDMGVMYTYKGDVDSTIYCYKHSISLARQRKDSISFLPKTFERLYDIYIQIGAYDSVKNVMPRDSLNYDNWAYYYKGTGVTDSAIYYFHKSLHNYNVRTDRRCLKELIAMEQAQGNLKEVVKLYEQLVLTEDSIKRVDRETELQRTQARYNYEQMRLQRDEQTRQKHQAYFLLAILVVVALLLTLMGYLFWRNKMKKEEVELARERLLRQEEETKRKGSEQQLADNQRQKEMLKHQQAEAATANDTETLRRLQAEADLLTAENQVIEARQRRHKLLLTELQNSDLYHRIKQNTGNHHFRLTDDEWLQLAKSLDDVYDDMTHRLLSLATLNQTELHIAYLLKLGIAPADMASILCKSKSSISMTRSRMYEKIFGKTGSATDLDEYIRHF